MLDNKPIQMKNILTLFTLTMLISSITIGQEKESLAKKMTTKTLPDLEVTDLKGNQVNMKSFSENNKITVISFWATWCSPCKKELSNLSDLYEDWQADYDVEIIAVSIDDSRNKAKVQSFVDAQGWPFEVLLDANQDLKRSMNFQTIPYTVMTDETGVIVYSHTGYVEGDEYVLEDEISRVKGN